MVCIYCKSKTKVTNSRSSSQKLATWRRRECLSCSGIVTTREHIDYEQALRVQQMSTLEPFYRDKLFMSLYQSLKHRQTSLQDAKDITDTVMHQLLQMHQNGILTTNTIINTALATLNRFDAPAAVSYKAYHQA